MNLTIYINLLSRDSQATNDNEGVLEMGIGRSDTSYCGNGRWELDILSVFIQTGQELEL